jgi:hypothetical protein
LDQPGATYSSLMNAGVEIPRGSKSVMIVSHHLMEKKPGGTGTEQEQEQVGRRRGHSSGSGQLEE